MRTEPLFQSMAATNQGKVEIFFDDKPFSVPRGVSVASALLLVGADYTRESPVTNARRAPYCMMGVCFECLVEIDGQTSVQSCLVEVREGMRILRQRGAMMLAEVGT